MVEISPVITKLATSTISVTWTPVTENDTFGVWDVDGGCPVYADKSVQIVGTLGTATFSIQGSNDGTNFSNLSDPQGNALTGLGLVLEQILENTAHLRPLRAGGSGTDVSVIIVARGIVQLR